MDIQMVIYRNPWTYKWISIEIHGYLNGYPQKSMDIQTDIHRSMNDWRPISMNMDIHFMNIYCLRISIAECPCYDIRAWISMWIPTLVWIIKDWHPKIMDIHVDIRRFLEIHAWICYGFLNQGEKRNLLKEGAWTSFSAFIISFYF